MKVKLLANLGEKDATAAQLEQDKAIEGATVNVPSKVAEAFIKRGIAADPAGAKDFNKVERPEAADDGAEDGDETDLESLTKHELKAYADEHGIEGVTMAMAKDDMIAAIQAAG